MILQGTTPTLVITFNESEIALSDVEEIELVFAYLTTTVSKSLSDVTVDTDANTISYTFTEAETLALPAGTVMYWQIRLLTNTGTIVGTAKQTILVDDLISTESMTS